MYHHIVDDILKTAHEYYALQMITQTASQSTIYKT